MANTLDTDIARHIWASRYRNGAAESSIEDSWQRVAKTIAAAEPHDPALWQSRFSGLLQGFRFLPGGRILAGAGTGRRVTLFNCFVMGAVEDSLSGIFDSLREAALTLQQGGGIGYDFSTLRPCGEAAPDVGAHASGPVSFMRVWDAMCASLMAAGNRRGAMMASLRCDHPDIEAFIDAKREAGVLTHFNLSVQVSDGFLQAVSHDGDWPLVFPLQPGESGETLLRDWPGQDSPQPCRIYRRVCARELWQRLLQAAYDTAEPGVLFTDTLNRENNLAYAETLATTNPCGEIPLPAYGACDLGSLNLSRFVIDAFLPSARMDFDSLAAAAGLAVRFLDDVIDVSEFPLPQQAAAAKAARRIGLGVSGLADALLMLGLHYGSEAGRQAAVAIVSLLRDSAYRASVGLAREKGVFPLFDRDRYLAGTFVRRLPGDLREAIARDGIRNSHLLAIAPTGTISLLAGNISSGIEPVFAFRAERSVQDAGGLQHFVVDDYAWARRSGGRDALPDYFVDGAQLSPQDHLLMQAALQPFVDNAIAKTVSLPVNLPFADFAGLFQQAHALGLKGLTVFRPNALRGEVIRESVSCPLSPARPALPGNPV